MSPTVRPNASAIAWMFSPDRALEVDLAARDRADGHLAHVHVRQRLERAGLAGGDHRHRAAAAAGHDPAALERIDRKVDPLATATDLLFGLKQLPLSGGANDDLAGDRQQLELLAHPRGGGFLRRNLVGSAEPAGTRQRCPLSRACVALAKAVGRGGALDLDRLGIGDDVGHARTLCVSSAAARTSSSTPPIALSRSLFSITGTPSSCARSTMKSWR